MPNNIKHTYQARILIFFRHAKIILVFVLVIALAATLAATLVVALALGVFVRLLGTRVSEKIQRECPRSLVSGAIPFHHARTGETRATYRMGVHASRLRFARSGWLLLLRLPGFRRVRLRGIGETNLEGGLKDVQFPDDRCGRRYGRRTQATYRMRVESSHLRLALGGRLALLHLPRVSRCYWSQEVM